MTPRYVREDVERDRYEIERGEDAYYRERDVLTVLWSEPEDGHRDAENDDFDADDVYDRLESEGGHL